MQAAARAIKLAEHNAEPVEVNQNDDNDMRMGLYSRYIRLEFLINLARGPKIFILVRSEI